MSRARHLLKEYPMRPLPPTPLNMALGYALCLPLAVSAQSSACGDLAATLTDQPFILFLGNGSSGQCSTVKANTAMGFVDALRAQGLGQSFPGGNASSDAISTAAGFNGLPTQLSFAQGSSVLQFAIPGLGVQESFAGADRDASLDMLKDYLKKNNIMSRVLNYQAKHSPFSPITGQGGLIPSTISADFGTGFTDVVSQIGAAAPGEGGVGNQVQLNAALGFGKVGNTDVKTYSLPLSYAFRNSMDPRRQLILQLPITYTDIGGAKTVQAGLGVAYRFPITDHWTLTPNVKYSAVGSADLATVSSVYSATLASAYVMEFKGFDLAIGNMLGVYKSGTISTRDYSFNPDITTTGMRNGIMLLQPVTLGGSKLSLEYSLIDTRYFGDKPFADNSQEIGITLGTNKSALSARSYLRAGLSYERSKSGNFVKLNFGYWF